MLEVLETESKILFPHLQEVVLVKQPDERLGMHIKGGLNGQKGNPYDPSDEGVFVSKINSTGAARRDGRLKVGMRMLEVNGVSLLGATHQEAVDCLRSAGNEMFLVVCKGYDKSGPVNPINISNAPKVDANGAAVNTTTSSKGSRASETGSELSHSISSLDRDVDEVKPVPSQKPDIAENESEKAAPPPPQHLVAAKANSVSSSTGSDAAFENNDRTIVQIKEKSTPEKVGWEER